MADMLAQGDAWLNEQRNAHMASEVTYARGASTVDLNATIGRTEFEVIDQYGVMTKVQSRDYILTAADLIIDAEVVTPKRGDKIRETDGDTVYIYEVMSPGQHPEWRYSDHSRLSLRIHTKQIGTEAAS